MYKIVFFLQSFTLKWLLQSCLLDVTLPQAFAPNHDKHVFNAVWCGNIHGNILASEADIAIIDIFIKERN